MLSRFFTGRFSHLRQLFCRCDTTKRSMSKKSNIKLNQAPFVKSKLSSALLFALFVGHGISACTPPEGNALNNKTDSNGPVQCERQGSPIAYSACHIDQTDLLTDTAQLQLFWQNKSSTPLLTFDALLNSLPNDDTLLFAMNAGMYNQQYAPIGYTVLDGKERLSLNLNEGGGNFHLLPNGVFWWDDQGFYINESHAFSELLASGKAKPIYATQSGPMLVIDGNIHPKFQPNSTSKKIRNGVGICQRPTRLCHQRCPRQLLWICQPI